MFCVEELAPRRFNTVPGADFSTAADVLINGEQVIFII